MRYLLTTGHRIPKFYKSDGTTVEVELNYVETKLISSIDESGKLTHKQVGGTPPCTGNVWLVDSVDESLHRLAAHDVYPFINKAAARENAKRLGLQSFKYIAVPLKRQRPPEGSLCKTITSCLSPVIWEGTHNVYPSTIMNLTNYKSIKI